MLQPPYNLFERDIEARYPPLLPQRNNIVTLGYGALCRGLLERADARRHRVRGRRSAARRPEIPAAPLRAISRAAVQRLDQLAQRRFHRQ